MGLTRINNQALTDVTSAGLPSGSVVQVKSFEKTTVTTYSSTTFVGSGVKVSITPSSTSSKMMVFVDFGMVNCKDGEEIVFKLYRDDSDIEGNTYGHFFRGNGITAYSPLSYSYYDSPNTTSEVTYEVYGRSGSDSVSVNGPHTLSNAQITVMEIAG